MADGVGTPTRPGYTDMGDGTQAPNSMATAIAGSKAITLRASAAQTVGTVNGAAVSGLAAYRRFIFVCDITVSATDAGDTLDVYVDVSLDGAKWLNAVHFTQQAGDGAAKTEYAVLDPSTPGAVVIDVTSDAASGVVRPSAWGPVMRCRSVVANAGTANASHTFSVTAYGQA